MYTARGSPGCGGHAVRRLSGSRAASMHEIIMHICPGGLVPSQGVLRHDGCRYVPPPRAAAVVTASRVATVSIICGIVVAVRATSGTRHECCTGPSNHLGMAVCQAGRIDQAWGATVERLALAVALGDEEHGSTIDSCRSYDTDTDTHRLRVNSAGLLLRTGKRVHNVHGSGCRAATRVGAIPSVPIFTKGRAGHKWETNIHQLHQLPSLVVLGAVV